MQLMWSVIHVYFVKVPWELVWIFLEHQCVSESESLFRCTILSHCHKDSFLLRTADLHSTHSYCLCLCLSLYLSLTWSLTDGTALILFLLLYGVLSKERVQSQHKWINYVFQGRKPLWIHIVYKLGGKNQHMQTDVPCHRHVQIHVHKCIHAHTCIHSLAP